MSILRTRLVKPLVSDRYVSRKRLFEKMDANLDASVHKVVAAAGYGKSIFVSQWLEAVDCDYCWITLEEDCNDIGVFMSYLIEALKSVDRDGFSVLKALKDSLDLPPSNELARISVNALQRIDQQIVLVFDDYHSISHKEVHGFFNEFLNHFPEQHLIVLISRFDPPLELSKMRAYGRVNEIRMAELLFNPEEIILLSEKQSDKPVSRETAEYIFKRTEGWVVPIRLLLKELASRQEGDGYSIEDQPKESTRIVHELLEDVFSTLDARVRESLMLASLFPRFSIDLLSRLHAVLYPEDKEGFDSIEILLEKLMDKALFIVPVDKGQHWYRFHQLVKEFLQSRCEKTFAGDTISTAIAYGSSYFAKQDDLYLAMQLSVQYKKYSSAIAFFNRDRFQILDYHRFYQFRTWLRLFPDKVVESDPSLLLIRAQLNGLIRKLGQMSDDLDRVKDLLTSCDQTSANTRLLWGEYYSCILPYLFDKQEIEKVLQYALKAMELIGDRCAYLHDHAMTFYVIALNNIGKPEEARAFLELYKRQLKSASVLSRMNFHTAEVVLGFMQGRLTVTIDKALTARRLAVENTNSGIMLLANYYSAVVLYQQNQLTRGMDYLGEALKSPYTLRPSWVIECYYLQCLFHLAMSEDVKAADCLDKMVTFQKSFRSKSYEHLLALLQTELFIRAGETDRAWKIWVREANKSISYSHHYYQSALTEAKLLMAAHPYQDLERARLLVKEQESLALRSNNRNLYMQTAALKVVLSNLKNEDESAVKLLRDLLSQTRQESIIRLYTDLGNPMQSVLERLATEDGNDPYILELAQSFKRPAGVGKSGANEHRPGLFPENAINISKKEIQILQMICEGYQNKEIAEKLYHSVGTVKTYVYNIYQKIGVRNRAEAIRYYKEHNRISAQKIIPKA